MKKMQRLAIAALVAVGLAGWAGADPALLRELESTFVQIHENMQPSVVNIDIKGSVPAEEMGMDQFEDLFKYFGLPQPKGGMPEGMPRRMPRTPLRQGTGSGFIYDKEGHIITNNHVVEGADKGITVRLSNGNQYEAVLVGGDPDTDIAVIKIDAKEELKPVVLADSSALKVGQFAIAVGSPRGLEGSFSFGHISALGRDRLQLPNLRFQNFIQTDAAINLGNSGGPLCNIDGQVIGINVAIVYGANSIGFAIPINTAKDVVPQLVSNKKVTRGYLGVGITDLTQLVAESLGLGDTKGAFVEQVKDGAPAKDAGVKVYDVIRKVNGEEVTDAATLIRLISVQAPGASVKLEVWRDKAVVELDVKLAEWKPETAVAEAETQSVLGISVQTLTEDMATQMKLESGTKGVLVTDVEPGSAADEAGISPGDVIIHVAQKPVTDSAEFFKTIKENAAPDKGLLIGIIREDGQTAIRALKVPADMKIE